MKNKPMGGGAPAGVKKPQGKLYKHATGKPAAAPGLRPPTTAAPGHKK